MVHTLFSSRAVNFSIPPKTLFTVRSHDWRGRLRWRGLYTRVSIKWEVGYFTVFIFFVGLNDLPGSEKYKYNNEAKTCDYYILCLSLSFLRDILVRVFVHSYHLFYYMLFITTLLTTL